MSRVYKERRRRGGAILQAAFKGVHLVEMGKKREEEEDFWQSNCTCLCPYKAFVHLVALFPSPIVKCAPAGRSIDLLRGCDNWAIKIAERHPACGGVFPESGLPSQLAQLIRFLYYDNKQVWKDDAAHCCALIAFE